MKKPKGLKAFDGLCRKLANGYITGMSLRTYLAAMAMQGMLASDTLEGIAKYAVQHADALIAELNKQPKTEKAT
jgi:hypothetical protein